MNPPPKKKAHLDCWDEQTEVVAAGNDVGTAKPQRHAPNPNGMSPNMNKKNPKQMTQTHAHAPPELLLLRVPKRCFAFLFRTPCASEAQHTATNSATAT